MVLKALSLKDKKLFDRFLELNRHDLSVYAFENIYIWKGLFKIYWTVIQDNLCVFFKDKLGYFLYLTPQGEIIQPEAVEASFKIMDSFNKNHEISRIENVEEKDLPFYQGLGYKCFYKSCDYVCSCSELIHLKGNKFKSQRASFNYFGRHYQAEYLPFSLKYKDSCLRLYDFWMEQRKDRVKNNLYQGMIQDSRRCLKVVLNNYCNLNFIGRIVKIGAAVKGFTFGFKLSKDTFCILYEITDLSIKGLAQFIFRQFSCALKDYKYINIMDDSGLENLKRVKLSYHPLRLIPAYIVTRNKREGAG